jgi:UDP-N-acetylglucosamine 3-dehydrogenase
VGLGAMGGVHARVLRALESRYEIIGGYDPRVDARTPDGVDRLGSDEEAIARADVVVIASSIETHARLATRALAAGRHVLVEKPICATSAEASALVAAARAGVRLFVGHSERFNPVVRVLARLVGAEEVLRIDLLRVGRSRPGGACALVNLGVHDLDLAAYLGGGEVALQGAVGSAGDDTDEDFAHVLFSTASGGSGHVYVDGRSPIRERRIVLTTPRWVYHGDLLGHRLVRSTRTSSAKTDVPLPLEEPLLAQAVALADALDGKGSRELATGADGARAVQLAERAFACFGSNGAARSSRFQGTPGQTR